MHPSPESTLPQRTGDDDPAAPLEPRGGAGWLPQVVLLVLLVASMWELSRSGPTPSLRILFQSHLPVWVPASAIIFWRWGWAVVHWVRAAIYRWVKYPRLQQHARAALTRDGPVPEVAVLLVTYKERAEITRRVMLSVIDELGRIESPRRPPVIVAVTGSDADDEAISLARERGIASLPPDRVPELVLLRGTDGKRDALAKGLELLLDRGMDPDGVFVMMDGDTHLEPGALTKVLPLFRLTPTVYAVTTNEHARVDAPSWFCEWIHLRHGLRHLYNCSISLSDRLLCLTGRFSVFRAASLDRGFIDIVRDDTVDHWLWGRYKLLSGDDKSTWFYLLAQGRRLLYASDAAVVTHEVVSNRPLLRAYHNLRRWGGNMVRNSPRAISVGPARLGLFCWWCLIDQRVAIWTTLIGPTAIVYMIYRQRLDLVAGYLLWVLCSRLVRAIPACLHGRRVSFFYGPLAVLFDWAGALVKIWVMFFPARQFWLNRGARELDSTRGAAHRRDRRIVSGMVLATALVVYGLSVGQLVGAVRVVQGLAWATTDLVASPVALSGAAAFVVVLSALILSRIRSANLNQQ
jgi:glycosyltransferase Alg8